METPLIADRYFDPKEAIRETERFVTIKKNPPCKGDFSKGFYPFVIEDEFSIFVFSRKANIFTLAFDPLSIQYTGSLLPRGVGNLSLNFSLMRKIVLELPIWKLRSLRIELSIQRKRFVKPKGGSQ